MPPESRRFTIRTLLVLTGLFALSLAMLRLGETGYFEVPGYNHGLVLLSIVLFANIAAYLGALLGSVTHKIVAIALVFLLIGIYVVARLVY